MNIINIIFVLIIMRLAHGAKILGVFPIPASAHNVLATSLMKELSERGHDVTIITLFKEKNPPKSARYREIVLSEIMEEIDRRRDETALLFKDNVNSCLVFTVMNYFMLIFTEKVLNHDRVQRLIHSNENFDVVIADTFMNKALFAFADHFQAPLILSSAFGPSIWVNTIVGNPAPTSYIPSAFADYSSSMTFGERLANSFFHLYIETLNHFYFYPKQNQMIQKYFPNPPQLDQILYNASVVFLNSHPSIHQAVPAVPNMIEIGGLHIKSSDSLPKDLQEVLDKATSGVIYFSLGSNLKSVDLPIEKRDALLAVFSKLKQKVLWKWETELLPGQSPNIVIRKWFPQQAILAHPNLQLFITHGGLLSTIETVHHGVPALAIPVYFDQKLNARRIVDGGFGLSLNYGDVSEDKLKERIDRLLSDPTFARNAKQRSARFRDRLVKPMDTAIYWVEHVIRHRGAPHLRVAAVELPWYRYHNLDVVVFVGVLVVCWAYAVYKLVRKLCSMWAQKQKNKQKKNN